MSDFLEDLAKEETVSSPPRTVLEQVGQMVKGWSELQDQIEKMEAHLKTLKDQERNMAEQTIPSLLKTNGITALDLEDGKHLSIEEKVFVRVPEDPDKKTEAIQFLFDNGGGSLVKDQLIVEDASEEIKKQISAQGGVYEEKQSVNTNSLTAWAKDVLGIKKGSVQRIAPSGFPKVMGLYTYSQAKLK